MPEFLRAKTIKFVEESLPAEYCSFKELQAIRQSRDWSNQELYRLNSKSDGLTTYMNRKLTRLQSRL